MDEPIGVVCPSRDRPQYLFKLAESMVRTSARARLYAYVDDDQRELYEAIQFPDRVTVHVGPKIGPTASVNALVETFRGPRIYGVAPDDTTFQTPGWDEWTLAEFERFPGRLGVVSPAHPYGAFVNFPYVSREWIDLVGWMAEPTPFHFVWDTILEMLGDATRISYAPKDKFYMANEAKEAINYRTHFQTDCEKFLWWCVIERRALVTRIRAAIEAAGG